MSPCLILVSTLWLAGQVPKAAGVPVPARQAPRLWLDDSENASDLKNPATSSGAVPEEPMKTPGEQASTQTEPTIGEDKKEEAKAEEPKKEPAVLFPGCCEERVYDRVKSWKDEHHIPLVIGAWNWFHVNTPDGPNRSGYGIPPNLKGTYYYYLDANPEMEIDLGPVSKIGATTEVRFRDEDKFRPFFTQQIWTYELYAWAQTPVGRFKAGQIVKRFGFDWDDSFWGNVEYADGFKLNPDVGFSWENTWKVRDGFQVDSFAQFFLNQDGFNGGQLGADPESVPGSHRRNMGVARLVPTWTFSDKSTLALGLSALVGEIDNKPGLPQGDHSTEAWAVDLTYTRGPFKGFAEVLQSYGVINPTRYVSGGPSERITDAIVGGQYRVGPVNFRMAYSAGFDEAPSGWQSLFVPGVTVALTKNVDLYVEYVKWDIFRHGARVPYEDGFQLVLNWRY